MINLTDNPVTLVEGAELDRRIRRGMERFHAELDKKYQVREWMEHHRRNKSSLGKDAPRAIAVCFELSEMPSMLLGQEFVQRLYDAGNIGSRNEGIADAFSALTPFLTRPLPLAAHIATKVKGFLRLILLALWSEKAIALPFSFSLGGMALLEQAEIIVAFESEVAAFFRQYKQGTSHRPEDAPPLPITGAGSLFKYGPRVIWASDYHRFEDVSLVEFSQFRQTLLKGLRGEGDSDIGRSHPPVVLMLREMATCHPKRMRYSGNDVDALALWALRPNLQAFPFTDFLTRREEILDELEGKRKESNRAAEERRARKEDKTERSTELQALAAKQDHDAVVEYFSRMRGIVRNGDDWLLHGAPYAGREHVNLKDLAALWLEAWKAYLKYRKNIQGFETEAGPTRAFNVLCDYLFLYLPWWKELFPGAEVDIPLAPNKFKRGLFVHRTQLEDGEAIPVTKMPLTLLDLLPKRAPSPDSRYGTLHAIMQFLEWVEVGFEDDARIAGPGYRSPLRRIDLPRVGKKHKTTKTPFTKKVYPHLLFFSYAVEAFGEYLQQLAMERPDVFAGKRLRQQNFYLTGPTPEQVAPDGKVDEEFLEDWPENYGYVPFIRYRGKNYPIYRVPNIYHWAERLIDFSRYGMSTQGTRKCFLPHLSTLRMLLGAIETGLRLQSIQWLDLHTWDILNKRDGVPPCYDFNMTEHVAGRFVLPLMVSTDKTKDEAWDVLVVFRVRACFYREQYFRDSIRESDMDVAVDYDGIENSRFGKITPLFRSPVSPAPVSDTTYDRHWRMLLWGFEEYFNNAVSAEGEFVQFVYLKGTKDEPVPDYSDTDIDVIRAINTPHACRATYATNRTGALESSDVAQQLGHASTVVTAHYTVSTPENMAEKIAAVEREIQAGFGVFDNANPAYIRTDNPNSALYKSFKENREETIESFRFAPSVSLWSTDDLKAGEDGMDLLRQSPMSHIRFRETHICPVGEACPADVVAEIGESRRCGLCPLAMRCVDHLPAIAAKVNQLRMKVRSDIKRAEQLAERNEPPATVDALYEAAEMDANELVGWQLSHDILLRMLETRQATVGTKEYHVQAPEIVERHLRAVTANRKVSEFLLQRIADANAYPTLADPEIQRVADRFCRHILAGHYQPSLDDDPVTVLAGLVKSHLEPLGVTMQDLATRIDQFEVTENGKSTLMIDRKTLLLADAQGVE